MSRAPMPEPPTRTPVPPSILLGDGSSERDEAQAVRNDDPAARLDLRGRSLRVHAARGVLVNGGFTIAMSSLGLLRGVILAGLLGTSDFGVWGITVISLGTLLWLTEIGIGDKYIQQNESDQELAFHKAWTLQILFTALSMTLLLAALPLIVLTYSEPEILLPGLLVVLCLPAAALQMPVMVYYRQAKFVHQRLLLAVEPIIAFIVAVGLAAAGAGYWALFAGYAAGVYSGALVMVVNSPYRFRFRYDRGALRHYASFSWPLFVAGIGGVVIAQGAILASYLHLGLAAAGAVTLAATINQFTNQVDRFVTETLYPFICAVKDRTELLMESFVKSNRLALMWAVPFGCGLALFCSDLVTFVIGDKWEPAVVLLQVTGFVAAIGHIGYNWDAYFRARGETRPIAIAACCAAIAFVATGIPLLFVYGLRGLALGLGVQMVAHVACRAYYLQKLFHSFAFARHALRAIVPSVPALATVLLMRAVESGDRTAGVAAAELSVYLAVTIAATWLIEGQLLREALDYVRGRRPAALPA